MHVLIMPRQGNTVESCILVDWKVKEGDAVAADTTVCDVETDKATFEVPAGESGTVLKLLKARGDDVPVLEPIAVIGQAGEDWAAALGGAGGNTETPVPGTAASAGESPQAASGSSPASSGPGLEPANLSPEGRIPLSPRARNLAIHAGRPVALKDGKIRLESGPELSGSGPGGRIIERDVAAALEGLPLLSAAARSALGAGGLTTPAAGSGLAGRIMAADLAGGGALPAAAAGGQTSQALPDSGEGLITETPIKGIRKLIADRMHRSLAESAQFTLNAAAPVKRLQELRSRMKTA
ncbi:MAG: 2-oxo acid dehydrogenase subunit E2, partial [Spirochaetaceae bacterium]|nr:2-oxo acid dehydrogenase subunit E2 [Spirochaetaceae bacterium]